MEKEEEEEEKEKKSRSELTFSDWLDGSWSVSCPWRDI